MFGCEMMSFLFENRLRSHSLLCVFIYSLSAPSCVWSETLSDAIALAYQSNPMLQAQRAQQRELDETYVQARAGWRPLAGASGLAYWSRTNIGAEYGGQSNFVSSGANGYNAVSGGRAYQENFGTGQISAVQPIYTGGKVAAMVRGAEGTVLAGRENLRTVEAAVILSVVSAYEDVRLNQQILDIRNDNADVLRSQLAETQAKFDMGQLTRTDVAQAQAQLANANALLAVSKANLEISRANYAAVVGQNPGELATEPPLPGLAASVDRAFDVAECDNPALRQARLTEQSSRAKIVEARAAYRPTVSATASVAYQGTLQPFGMRDFGQTISAEVTITQPIFTGGANGSLVRQAMEQNTSDRIEIEGVRRTVVQSVAQAWNAMVGDQASVTSNEEQVRAAQVAFEGVREQYRVGLSTTLDVLIQQTNLENAQLALVQVRHDTYIAQAALLQVMGRLEARSLAVGAPLYDPIRSFNRVKNAGALTWEPLIAALDSVGSPEVGLPVPMSAAAAQILPESGALLTVQPMTLSPNTAGPCTPRTLGTKPEIAAPATPTPESSVSVR